LEDAVETVLIVEDELLIAWTVEDELTDAGHKVVVAHTADEAIQLLEKRSDITTLFTDIDMPGTLNGLKLAACVSRRWPPVKIIVTTGKARPDETEMPKGSKFLPKPYLLSQLRAALA
jgi:DNA-binding NtrC family response regulator